MHRGRRHNLDRKIILREPLLKSTPPLDTHPNVDNFQNFHKIFTKTNRGIISICIFKSHAGMTKFNYRPYRSPTQLPFLSIYFLSPGQNPDKIQVEAIDAVPILDIITSMACQLCRQTQRGGTKVLSRRVDKFTQRSLSTITTTPEEPTSNSYNTHINRLQAAKLRALRDRVIRVDHAGEYGANRIYAGQMAVLAKTKSGPLIQHMWDQEKVHLDIFEKLMPKYRARPTVLLPFWNVAGYALGAGTALLGEKAAMACTVAVESSITEHYNNQIRELMAVTDKPEENKELLELIQKCRDEEQEHHDTGIEHDAEQAPGYAILTRVIKTGCKTAIWLSERI